jgi:hypothetical protein
VKENGVPGAALAVLALVMTGGASTLRVKVWDVLPRVLAAVIVIG